MTFPPLASRARNFAGFTLLELLVVITIIAILASIILSVFGSVQNRARKVQAVNDMRNTNAAMVAYYTDYQHYPLNDVQVRAVQNGDGDTIYGDPGPDPGNNPLYTSADLFNILRAVADNKNNPLNAHNPNQTVYWGGSFAKSATQPREGITTQDVTLANGNKILKGSLVDPWGNCYIVFIDADKSGEINKVVGYFWTDVGTVKVSAPPLGVAFCSMGPDGVFGTKTKQKPGGDGILKGSDDIVTWQ